MTWIRIRILGSTFGKSGSGSEERNRSGSGAGIEVDPNSAKCSGSGSETLVLMMMEYKICKNRKFGSDNPFVDLKPVELHKLISIYMSKLFKKRSYKTFMLYFIRSYSGKRVRPGHLLILQEIWLCFLNKDTYIEKSL